MKDYIKGLWASVALAPEGEGGGAPEPSQQVEVRTGGQPTSAVTFDREGKATTVNPKNDGTTASFADGEVTTRAIGEGEPEEEDKDGDGAKAADAETGDTPPADEDAPEDDGAGDEGVDSEPLPEFDPENDEIVAAYDGRYYSEVDGKPVLNIDRLGEVAYANSQKEGGKLELNPGDYAYLEARLGITREMADDYMAMRVDRAAKQEAAFYETVGGKENWESQLAWGKENYTPAQKEAFNKAMKSNDKDAIQEQIDLLDLRAKKGGWKGVGPKPVYRDAEKRNGPLGAPRRPVSPNKSASTSEVRTAGTAKGYANNAEYVAALKAAGDDKAEIEKVRKNLAASTFWKPRRG